jgi:glycosidase
MLFSFKSSKVTSIGLLFLCALAWPVAAQKLKLHVPSPDWRDQVIYFVMTDRFDDANPSNNQQGADEFDPRLESKYSGGDLQGVRRRLDYIQGLGASAVWITPPVANQWWNGEYGGYHGYWASNFKKVDPHMGNLKDYQQLSDALHRRGMFLVQDIVLNHTGDFFRYTHWNAQDPKQGYQRNAASRPMAAPLQAPFDMNDPRKPAHRKAGIYHWSPDIHNYKDRQQELNYQMSGLDDLNSENPVVRRALRESYGHWIESVGVDAFRVDTAFFVPQDALQDFLYSKDKKYPGMKMRAAQTGRKDFLTFGEGFSMDKPGQTQQMQKIESYVRDAKGQPVLQSMLNFPLYGSLGDVMARGQPTRELAQRIAQVMQIHSDPHRMPTFVDNHDVDRFLKGGSPLALRQSLLLLMTLPGIPTLYYGTEQGLTEQRSSMFAAGYGSQGRDHFDTESALYQFVKAATALRRQNKVFSRGLPTLLRDDAAGPGVLAYRMDHEGQSAWVVFNTAEHAVLLDALPLMQGLPEVSAPLRLQGAWGFAGASIQKPQDLAWPLANGQALLNLQLPARSAQVWLGASASNTLSAAKPLQAVHSMADQRTPQLPEAMPARVHADFQVNGAWPFSSAQEFQELDLKWVANGNLQSAQSVQWLEPQANDPVGWRRWTVKVDTAQWADASDQRIVLMAHERKSASLLGVSQAKTVRLERQWALLGQTDDPVGDDRGPTGQYRYPQDSTYVPGLLDLQRVQLWGAERALRLRMQMGALSQGWNPANGFDHVAFSVFIGKPSASNGVREMPLQQGQLPDEGHWHYRLRAHGWSNVLFSASGASAQAEGQILSGTARIEVDHAARTVQLDFPPGLLADLPSLAGLKVWVNTWDYDNGYRRISPSGGPSEMGGAPATSPLWMDSAVLQVPP